MKDIKWVDKRGGRVNAEEKLSASFYLLSVCCSYVGEKGKHKWKKIVDYFYNLSHYNSNKYYLKSEEILIIPPTGGDYFFSSLNSPTHVLGPWYHSVLGIGSVFFIRLFL